MQSAHQRPASGLRSFAARPPLILIICLVFALVIVTGALPDLFSCDSAGRRAKSRALSRWFEGGQKEVVLEIGKEGIDMAPSSSHAGAAGAGRRDKVAIAHFMVRPRKRSITRTCELTRNARFVVRQLGNTYPYKPSDWSSTLALGAATHLDAFALNLGPEPWQLEQAREAYRQASQSGEIKLMLSLDMNVLPSATEEDMTKLVNVVAELGGMKGQLKTQRAHLRKKGLLRKWQAVDEGTDKVVVSTFGGQDAQFGGKGWPAFLEACRRRGTEVSLKW